MNIYKLDEICVLSTEPDDTNAFNEWLHQNDVVEFLSKDALDEYIIIYAALPHVFIYGAIAPAMSIGASEKVDLLHWHDGPSGGWSVSCTSSSVRIERPHSGCGSKIVSSGEQIVFRRFFDDGMDSKNYTEISQKFCQVLDIHYVKTRKSWSKFDYLGDYLDVVRVVEFVCPQDESTYEIICARRSELSKYATLSDSMFVRRFDFSRFRSNSFTDWGDDLKRYRLDVNSTLFGRFSIAEGICSYTSGVQVLHFENSKQGLIDDCWGIDQNKEYCSYLAHDWKNRRIDEFSCDPGELASYFDDNELPHQLSSVFFNSEVLLKYKSFRAKYTLDDRKITCRGGWELNTYDMNEAGQVHTYLCYLGDLPYKEQLHWKQFNEKPKVGQSERSIRTDFLGEWDESFDPLRNLKERVNELRSDSYPWWQLRGGDATLNKVTYPNSESRDEWTDEIMNLDQLLVEGFDEKSLRSIANNLGCENVKDLRSLKLIEAILCKIGCSEDRAKNAMGPFHDLHNLRSKVRGHVAGSEAEQIHEETLMRFRTYKGHFASLCESCNKSIEFLMQVIGKSSK